MPARSAFTATKEMLSTLGFLAHELKMNYCFLPGRFKKRLFDGKAVDSFSGLGILSTYPVADVSQFILPDAPGDDDRKVRHKLK